MGFLVVEKSTDYVYNVFDVFTTDGSDSKFLIYNETLDTWSYQDASDFYAYHGKTNAEFNIYKPVTLNTITFESNGGSSISSQTIELPGLVEKPSDPVREGFIFGGWFVDDETFGEAFDFESDVIDEDVTIYAKWIAITYTASFITNGGTDVNAQTVEYEGKATLPDPAPTKLGFSLYNWYSDAELTEIYDFNTILEDDITLYAAWAAEVKFFSNGGSAIDSQFIKVGGIAIEPQPPTREGYNFVGWFVDNGTFLSPYDFEDAVVAAIDIYADWEEIVYKTVTFDVDGGSLIDMQTVEVGTKAIRPSNPTKEGYTFDNWFTDDETFINIFDFENTNISEDITLYAKWTRLLCVVTYDSNEGSAVDSENVFYGEYATEPTIPIKDSYTFDGWFTDDKTFVDEFNFATTAITNNIILYAKWVSA